MTTAPAFDRRLIPPLVIGALLNPINSSIIAVALVPIGHALGAPASQTALLVSALYVVTAIGQPVVGRLVDAYGPRRLFLASSVLIGVGGLVGALAPNLTVLVIARMVIGLGTCAGYPAAMYLIRSEGRRTGQDSPRDVLTILAVATQTVVVIGPSLGGALIAIGGWRSTFAINVPVAVLSCWLGYRRLPADPVRPAIVAGQPPGAAQPSAADGPGILRNAPLMATYARQFLAGLTAYSVLYGVSQWMQEGRGLHPAQAGLLLLPLSGAGLVVSAVSGRSPQIRAKLVVGAAFQLVGSAALLGLHSGTAIWIVVLVVLSFGVPQGLLSLGNQSALYHQADGTRIAASAGLLRTANYLGAIVSSAAIGAFFGSRAGTAQLHELAGFLVGASALLLAITLVDRRLTGVGQPAEHAPPRSAPPAPEPQEVQP